MAQSTLADNFALGGGYGGGNFGGSGVGQSAQTKNGGGPNGGSSDSGRDGYSGYSGGSGGFGGGGGYSQSTVGNAVGGSGGFGGGGGGGGFGGGGGGGSDGFGGGGGGMGGAIFNDAGSVTLTNVTLSGNGAQGGSSYAGAGSAYGGALFNYMGLATLVFVTASGNTVTAATTVGSNPGDNGKADGGAIYSLSDAIAACQAGGNTCPDTASAALSITGSLIANSVGKIGENATTISDVVVGVTDHLPRTASTAKGSGNLFGTAVTVNSPASSTLTSVQATPGPLNLADMPTLTGGLHDVMIPGSVAIDGATCPSTPNIDQRRLTRPQGAKCDIGAVEVRLFDLTVTTSPGGQVTAGTDPAPYSGGIAQCSATSTSTSTTDCSASYDAPPLAPQVTLTATATTGAIFLSWGGACSGSAPTCTVTMDQARTVSTQFAPTLITGPTVPSTGPGGDASAVISGGGTTCVFDADNSGFVAAPTTLPPGQRMPQGMFKFRLTGCGNNVVTMTITWPQPVSGYIKYGKASKTATDNSFFAPNDLGISGKIVSFAVRDGDLGDDDWTVNQEITDPSGPTEAIPAAAPVPTLPVWGLWLLGLLAAGLGGWGLRRRVR